MKVKKFLLVAAALIICFITVPVLHGFIPGSKDIKHVIIEKGIDANALFYSEESCSAHSKKIIEEKLLP